MSVLALQVCAVVTNDTIDGICALVNTNGHSLKILVNGVITDWLGIDII
jgi:hypothetical protein